MILNGVLENGVKLCLIVFRFYLVIKQSLLVVILIQFYQAFSGAVKISVAFMPF